MVFFSEKLFQRAKNGKINYKKPINWLVQDRCLTVNSMQLFKAWKKQSIDTNVVKPPWLIFVKVVFV